MSKADAEADFFATIKEISDKNKGTVFENSLIAQTEKTKVFSDIITALNLKVVDRKSLSISLSWVATLEDDLNTCLVYSGLTDELCWMNSTLYANQVSVIDVIKLLPDDKKEFLLYYLDYFDK